MRYQDRFNDNFSQNRVEVASRNHINFAASPGFTMLVGFGISLFLAIIVYLAITALLILKILLGFFVGGGSLLLLWLGLNLAVRSGAKTYAAVVFYLGQKRRNHVIETEYGPVLDDPMRQYRAAVEHKEVIKERYSNGSLPAPAEAHTGEAEPDAAWTNVLKGRNQQRREDRMYEADV
jgi:hypothetical protein